MTLVETTASSSSAAAAAAAAAGAAANAEQDDAKQMRVRVDGGQQQHGYSENDDTPGATATANDAAGSTSWVGTMTKGGAPAAPVALPPVAAANDADGENDTSLSQQHEELEYLDPDEYMVKNQDEENDRDDINHNSNSHHSSHQQQDASQHHSHHSGAEGEEEDDDNYVDMPFYTSPQQRQRWGDAQLKPHTDWGDIFFDLFYVAAAYKLGNVLRDEPSRAGLLYFAGLFFPIQQLWSYKMFFDGRFFVGEDMWNRIYQVAILAALATAILHIRRVGIMADLHNNNDMLAFVISMGAVYALCMGKMVEIAICSRLGCQGLYPEALITAKRGIIILAMTASFFLAAAVYSGLTYYRSDARHESSSYPPYPNHNSTTNATQHSNATDPHRELASDAAVPATTTSYHDDIPIWLCFAGGAYLQLSYLVRHVCIRRRRNASHHEVAVPVNIDYCIHRYGEWVMLMLGESVLSLMIVPLDSDGGLNYHSTFYTGLISIILLQYLHFRSQPHDPDEHALRKSVWSAWCFTFLMAIYSAALIILGASYKMFLYEYVYDDRPTVVASTTESGDHYDDSGSAYYNDSSNNSTDYHSANSTEHLDRRRLAFGSDTSNTLLSRFLPPDAVTRLLAGEDDCHCLELSTEDRRQRVANFFAISMAVVWFCLDAMTLTHRGLHDFIMKCQGCEERPYFKTWVGLLVLCRVALIAWIASLSQYVQEPELLSLLGMCGVIAQLCLRMVGFYLLPPTPTDQRHKEDHAIETMAQYAHARVQSKTTVQQ